MRCRSENFNRSLQVIVFFCEIFQLFLQNVELNLDKRHNTLWSLDSRSFLLLGSINLED
jgi:hypothetical protein